MSAQFEIGMGRRVFGRAGMPLARLPLPIVGPLLAFAFVAPLLLLAVVVGEPTAIFWTATIVDLLVLFVFALKTSRHPVLFVGLLTSWFVVQRIALAIMAPHISPDLLRLLLTYKEGFYMVLLVAAAATSIYAYLRRERGITPVMLADALAVALLVLLLVNFALSSAELSPKLTYARRFAAPILLFLGGRLLLPDGRQLVECLRLLALAAIAVAVFGLLERFVLGGWFWRDGVDALAFYRAQVEGAMLPASFIRPFQDLPEGIFVAFPLDTPVRRMVSTYLEPTTLGAFLALSFLLLLFAPGVSRARRGLLAGTTVLLSLAIVATLSRGGMQIALIGAGIVIAFTAGRGLRRPWSLQTGVLIVTGGILLAGLLVTSFSFAQAPNRRAQIQDVIGSELVSGLKPVPPPPPTTDPLNQGAQAHVNGLTSGLKQMLREPQGSGLGAAGAWSKAPAIGSESSVGTLAAQLGVAGLVLWLAFYCSVIAGLLQAAWRSRGKGETLHADVALVLGAALAGLFVTAWFSESASGLLGNAFFFLFAGWALAVLAPSAAGVRFRWLPYSGRG